jgi:hypothetical protein
MMVALGMGSSWVRNKLSGRPTDHWGPVKWTVEGVDRSGLMTVFSEFNNMLEKINPNFGLAGLTGEAASRYASRNMTAAWAGPSAGLLQDIVDTTSALSQDGWSGADTHRVRGLLPYQNLFYLRLGLDKVESEFNSFWGIPEKKAPKPKRTR